MLKKLRNSKGQGATFEYAIVFAIITAVVMAMTTYFKRAVQAQFSKAIHYADDEINSYIQGSGSFIEGTGKPNVVGKFVAQYEPYYVISEQEMTTDGRTIDREIGAQGAKAPIHEKEYDGYTTSIEMTSNQLAPKFAK